LSLPAPAPRRLAHTRAVTFHGYQREDGLWDIEGHLRDTKPDIFEIPDERIWQANEPIHDLQIRITIDSQLVIQAIEVSLNHIPHPECSKVDSPMNKMVGCRLGGGWRKAIEENLGNAKGCTHLRELLFNMATAAFQAVTGTFSSNDPDTPPPHLGRCMSWDFQSTLVERRYPMFFQWTPKEKK
jgi:Protein of unknown function (DUF2889)